MSLISLIIILAVVGFLMWLVNTQIPMAEPYKKILNIVVIVGVVIWLLNVFFGPFGDLGGLRVGRIR
jgi:hypothetical protein